MRPAQMPTFRIAADHSRRVALSYDLIYPLFAFADALIIVCSSIVGNAAYQAFIVHSESDLGTYLGLGLFFCIGYLLAARNFRIYELQEFVRPRLEYGRIFASWFFVVMLLSLFLFAIKLGAQISRGSIVCFVMIALSVLIFWRVAAKQIVRNELQTGAVRGRRSLVIGTRGELSSLSGDYLLTRYGIDEAERVILHSGEPDVSSAPSSIAVVQMAVNLARTINVNEVIVALPWGNTSLLEIVQEQFKLLPLRVRLLPDQFARSLMARQSGGDFQSQLIDIRRAPLSRTDRFLKRFLDFVLATLVLLIASPLMGLVFVLVPLGSKGSAIFCQRRNGFNGHEFVIYKFRTMRVAEDGPKIIQATKGDPRVTWVGQLLRRSSIDELPQLFNVLKGEMSLVGPRPHALAHDDEYGVQIGEYAFGHHVKPGITGLAQVEGFRGETGNLELMKKRIGCDLWYIDNWSLWLDLKILARTAMATLSCRNAH
jgi:Undecaprenyl-phosphate glucose phosphotransferase